nr:sugar transferase [Alteripontixanthobacter muriae]
MHFDHELEWDRSLAQAAISGRAVFHYKKVGESTTGKVQIQHLSENSFGALALPFALPLLVLVGVLVRWDSRGPTFFRQLRIGFRGEAFMVVKFRTRSVMEDGKDRDASLTPSHDERITRVGRFLRKTRLDELPQIWNIFKGDMSWIGPRPEAVSLSAWYEDEIPFYRYRHIVRPGITGWARVNQGHVSSIADVDANLQYDFYYIKNLSYWLDIFIALRTVRVVLSGFGAK